MSKRQASTGKPSKKRKTTLIVIISILAFLLICPLYAPQESHEPMIWGWPLWAWVTVGMAIAFTLLFVYYLRHEEMTEQEYENILTESKEEKEKGVQK